RQFMYVSGLSSHFFYSLAVLLFLLFFFFSSRRRHTRWPRDWSSDVCSSDLVTAEYNHSVPAVLKNSPPLQSIVRHPTGRDYHLRSEERRVGKECRSRWSPYH